MVALEIIVGAALVVVSLSDLVTTAVAPSLHGGWLTRRVGITLWAWTRRALQQRPRVLQFAGLVLVLGLVVTWISGLLLGWTLVLHAVADLRTTAGVPASWWDTVYYTGYTLSTMGNGDFAANGTPGQLLTVIASVTGLLALTMSITYLVPVLRAAADRRVVAATIDAIGSTPRELRERLWPDGETGHHDAIVHDLGQRLRATTQAHSSYPVLHFFSSRHREVAIAPNVTALDEALATVIAVDPDDAPLPERMLFDAIGSLLDALMASFVRVDPDDPPPSGEPYEADEQRAERRRRLAAWCHDDGWSWEQAVGPAASSADGHAEA